MPANREQVIREFVRNNLEALTSIECSKSDLNDLIRTGTPTPRRGRRFTKPTVTEILNVIVGEISQATEMSGDETEQLIDDVPWMRYVSADEREAIVASYFDENVSKKSTTLPGHVIENIRKVGVYQALEKEKGEEIRQEKQGELDDLTKEVDAKQKQLDEMPSILDAEEPVEPEDAPTSDPSKLWWQRYHLKENPFHQKDGLSKIDRSMFDDVVVKTKTYTTILGELKQDSGALFDTATLVCGQYGHGKTTLLDYLDYHFIKQKTVTARIVCGLLCADAKGYLDSFYLSLERELTKELKLREVNATASPESSIDDRIISHCQDLVSDGAEGLIIFMDDYHKHEEMRDEIFSFLGMLQILKNLLTRANSNVGFIVSGLPEWQSTITSDNRMSGFFDRGILEMPSISPADVTSVFNKRLKALSYDTVQAPTINSTWVESVMAKGPGGSFREYLNRIIHELEDNNLTILNTPLDISEEQLLAIKATFESVDSVAAMFRKLVKESLFKQYANRQIQECLKMVVQTVLQGGVSESEPLFLDHKFYYKRLIDLHILSRMKLKGEKQRFKWVPHNRLQEAIDKVRARHNGREIQDYLLKVYGGPTASNPSVADEPGLVEQTSEFLGFFRDESIQLKKDTLGQIEEACRLYESTLIREPQRGQMEAIHRRAAESMEALQRALYMTDSSETVFSHANIKGPARDELHWSANELAQQARNRSRAFQNEPNARNFSLWHPVYKDVFVSTLGTLRTVVRHVLVRDHGNEFIRFLDTPVDISGAGRDVFIDATEGYFDANSETVVRYMSAVNGHLEDRLRSFFYLSTVLVFGPDKYYECLPQDSVTYMRKNLQYGKNYDRVLNMYEGLTRDQFGPAFREGRSRALYKLILSEIDLPWSDNEWDEFFQATRNENIKSTHRKNAKYSILARRANGRICDRVSQFCCALNRAVKKLVCQGIYLVQYDDNDGANVGDIEFIASYSIRDEYRGQQTARVVPAEKRSALFPFMGKRENLFVAADQYERVAKVVLREVEKVRVLNVDVLDLNFIASHYDCHVHELFCTLAYLEYVACEIRVDEGFGSQIWIQRVQK